MRALVWVLVGVLLGLAIAYVALIWWSWRIWRNT